MIVIIARHGKAESGPLTDQGRSQRQALGMRIKERYDVDKLQYLTLHSSAERAVQSVACLGLPGLVVVVPTLRDLTYDQYTPKLVRELDQLVEKQEKDRKVDVLVMVTYRPITNNYPADLMKNRGMPCQWLMVEQGQAVSIDLNTQEVFVI